MSLNTSNIGSELQVEILEIQHFDWNRQCQKRSKALDIEQGSYAFSEVPVFDASEQRCAEQQGNLQKISSSLSSKVCVLGNFVDRKVLSESPW